MYLKYPIVILYFACQIGYISAEGDTTSEPSDHCYTNVKAACTGDGTKKTLDTAKSCTAGWGAFPSLNEATTKLISTHLTHSLQYMLTASHFNQWNVNRPGFVNYFSKLSDEEWESGVSLMMGMIERGGTLVDTRFKVQLPANTIWKNENNEIDAMGWALDTEKAKALQTLHLAHDARHQNNLHTKHPLDAEFADFVSERLSHNAVLRIKHMANYVNILSEVVKSGTNNAAYAMFVFDNEILK